MPDPTEPSEPSEPVEPITEPIAEAGASSRLATMWRDPRQRLALLGGGALVAIVVIVLLVFALAGGSDADGERDAASDRTTRTTAADRDGDTVPDDEDADPDDPDVGRRTTTTGSGTARTTTTTTGGGGTGSTPPNTVRGGFPVPPTTFPGDPVLERAYVEGFTDECNAIFGLSPNGRMFDPETPDDVYSAQDCLADMYPEYGNDYSTPEAAAEAGRTDAIDAVGLLTALGKLCWGDDSCWDWEDAF